MLILHAANLAVPGIRHGFFGRTGGVSQGLYASLNCAPASKDARERVAENRRLVAAEFGGVPLVTLQQYHSAEAVTVTTPWTMEKSPGADAMATKVPGILLGINTADCAPVLMCDPEAKVIGAAHAGWKGALAGVCEATIDAMEKLGAARGRIRAAIGPYIAQKSYEVSADFRDPYPEDAAPFFAPAGQGHLLFDNGAYVAARLAAAGIRNVEKSDADTFARQRDFFSFRRATILGEPDYGREISAIMLAG